MVQNAPTEIPEFMRYGNTEHDQLIHTLEDMQLAVMDAAQQALRSIKIYTPDLEPGLYDNQAFIDLLVNFIRGNRHASVQILVQNSEHAVQFGHRLVRLAQNLTSAIEVRTSATNSITDEFGYLLVDQSTLLYRSHYRKNTALFTNRCKHRNDKLQELFNFIWETAELDQQVRRLTL